MSEPHVVCPECRRSLPAVRGADRDFMRCVCCKLDDINRRHRWRYEHYMQSREWWERRALFLEMAGRRCQRCGNVGGLEVHHKHYETLGYEREQDVEVLCHRCHGGADSERYNQKMSRIYDRRLSAWARKKYGYDWWMNQNEVDVSCEFDAWVEEQVV